MFKNKEYIYLVYKEQSFSKAADKLHISQPSLSITIKKTEQELGAQIFNRNSHALSLTPFGVEYIHSIEKIHELENHLHDVTSDLDNLQRGILSIGGSSLSLHYIIPEIICTFKKKYPNVRLLIKETSTLKSKHLLDEGIVDLIVSNRPLESTLYEQIFLYHEHLLVAVPKNFAVNKALADKKITAQDFRKGIANLPIEKEVSIAHFANEPFIFLHDENYLRFCTNMLFESEKITPHTILEVEDTDIAINFASYGLGATIVADCRIANTHLSSLLCFYKIKGKQAQRNAYLYSRKSVSQTNAMKKFVDMALSMCNTLKS